MGLIDRIFKGGKDRDKDAAGITGPASTEFYESEPASDGDEGSRNTPRRELVQVMLRDAMRKHGIPSDWIECRLMSTVSRSGRTGMHVNFVVKQAHDQMLGYVFPFQQSFEREITRFDPRARDWLLSLGWEFHGFKVNEVPEPNHFGASAPAPLAEIEAVAGKAPAPAATARRAPAPSFAPTVDPVAAEAAARSQEDVERDLRALFAIRDADLAAAARQTRNGDQADFQHTEPSPDGDRR